MLEEIGLTIAENLIRKFFNFAKSKNNDKENMEQLNLALMSVFHRVQNLASYNKFTELFSDGQLQRIYERFAMPATGEDTILKKHQEIMDTLNPPINEESLIKKAVYDLCELLFRFANPINQEGNALANRIVQATTHSLSDVKQQLDERYTQIIPNSPRKLQVLNIDQFIATKNATTINASLDRTLYHREKELQEAIQKLESVEALVLSGFAGVGKTRLALEIVRHIAETEGRETVCIHSHGAELYQELQSTLKSFRRYVLLVDDANEFTELQHVLVYIAPNTENINVKAVFTVRSYAQNKVLLSIRQAVGVDAMILKPMARQDIIELISGEYPNFTSLVVEQIARIAQGNARLALMGAQCIQKEQSLEKINNATELYDQYYEIVLNDNPVWSNRTNLCTAAIIAMVNVIDMEHMGRILPLLDSCKLTEQTMQESVEVLHVAEVADLYQNRAVKIPDQCLGDYLIKKTLINKRWIPLTIYIETCYDYHRQALIRTISMLLNVFSEESIVQELTKALKSIWRNWEAANDMRLWGFIMAFHRADPLRTFAMLKNHIDSQQIEAFDVRQIDFDKNKNHLSYSDDILMILSEYRYAYTEAAIRLILDYYSKRPSLYMQVYHCLYTMACPNGKAYHTDFCIQNDLAAEMMKLVQAQADEATILLCGRIAIHMLGLNFSDAYSADNNSLVVSNISMIETEKSRSYRAVLWDLISMVMDDATLQPEIMSFLEAYARPHKKISEDVIRGDLPFIRKLIDDRMKPDRIIHAVVLEKLKRHMHDYIPLDQLLFIDTFFQTKAYAIAQILLLEDHDVDYHARKSKKQSELQAFSFDLKTDEIALILSTATELAKHNSQDAWLIASNFSTIMKSMDDRPEMQLILLQEYLRADAPLGLSFTPFFQNLMHHYPISELWEKIHVFEPVVYESAEFELLSLIPQDQVTQEYLLALKKLFDNHPSISSSPYRSLKFLSRYQTLDPQIVPYILRSLLQLGKQKPFLLRIYGYDFFNEDTWLLSMCNDELELVFTLYIESIKADMHIDYEGNCFVAFLQANSNYLLSFLQEFLNRDSNANIVSEKLSILMNEDNYLTFFEQSMHEIMKSDRIFAFRKGELLSEILHGHDSECNIQRINECLHTMFEYCKADLVLIEILFCTLDNLPQECRRYTLITWLKSSPCNELLKNVHLGKRMYCISGSLIPFYQQEIQLFKDILSELSSIDNLDSAYAVQQHIEYLTSSVDREKLNEFLTDR